MRNIEDSPTYYRGCDITKFNGRFKISTKTYVKEVLRSFQDKHGDIPKENIPLSTSAKPELDKSDLLDIAEHKIYQQIIGVCQWLIVCGRMDICYAVSSLSRFSVAPRKGHLELAKKLYGYLKNIPRKATMLMLIHQRLI